MALPLHALRTTYPNLNITRSPERVEAMQLSRPPSYYGIKTTPAVSISSTCDGSHLGRDSRLSFARNSRTAACLQYARVDINHGVLFKGGTAQRWANGHLLTAVPRVPSLAKCMRPTSLKCVFYDIGKKRHGRRFGSFGDSSCQCKPRGSRESPHEYTPGHQEDETDDSGSLEVVEKGYVIKVSKELMGLFCYIEKKKRTKIQELSNTLRQVAAVALVLTCVRGILGPLLEVFKTTPPSWPKLLLMLVSFDSIAISYLAVKASEPLEQLAALTTENRPNIMDGVEKEEEMMLNLATEFIRLFRRLRNIAISITVSQTAQLIYTALKLKDPDFVANCSKIVGTWMLAPWS